jgi:hypothetical protein
LNRRSLRYFLGMAQPIPAGALLHSFRRHLEAENRSERTLASYLQSVRQAEAFLAGRGKRLEEASRADLEAFLSDLLRRRAPATAATRYKVLRILYRWLEEEEEIEANPMARMKPPIVPEQPVPVVPEDGLRRLLAVCAGKGFEARRDTPSSRCCWTPALAAVSSPASGLAMWTSTWTCCWCSARAAASGRCRSAEQLHWRWTATCALASVTRRHTLRGCGLARREG